LAAPPITAAAQRAALIAELRSVSRTLQFWIIVARQSIAVIGTAFFGWHALEIGLYFAIQSWLMLSLYAATDLTFDPKYLNAGPVRAWKESAGTLLKNFLAASLLTGILIGLFGGIALVGLFRGDAWGAFIEGGWHEPSFLCGVGALAASCVAEAARYLRSLPRRTAAEIEADDMRIASTFYRVVLLFMATVVIGALAWTGFTDLLFVVATALILTYFEALPRNASLLLGDVLKKQ
jgi:hypothetical protein